MSQVTPNMGLTVWNLGGDFFNYSQLLADFQAIDDHDHTSGNGVQVPTGGIANLAITTAKIADLGITTAKINTDAVTSDKIADDAVGSDQIAADAVGTSEIAPDSVGASEIAPLAVTGAEIANSTIGDGKLITRIIRGKINADGSIGRGTGFTVSKPGTGQYVITYTSAFSTNPVGVATLQAGGDKMLYVDDGFTTKLEVYTQDESSGPEDQPFSFIVVSA